LIESVFRSLSLIAVLQFGFLIFWQKGIDEKSTCKMSLFHILSLPEAAHGHPGLKFTYKKIIFI